MLRSRMGQSMKTKLNTVLFGTIAVLSFLSAGPTSAADLTRLDARSGSKMRLEGTSTVHDWQVESPLILGYIEVGPNFPIDPGQNATPGKVEVKGEATITVKSLRSIEKDGK